MPNADAKLELMELFSKYLLCLDERRFDHESFAEIFTESAEVSIPSNIIPERECRGLQEIRDIHAALFRQIKSSHHASSDYIFLSLSEQSAEVRCNLSSCYNSFSTENGDSFIAGTVNFSAVKLLGSWKIQKMRRKTQCVFSLGINIKNKEVFS